MLNRIKEIRLSKLPRMTIAKLAELVGLSSRAVQYLETGEHDLTLTSMITFGKALGVYPSELLPESMCPPLNKSRLPTEKLMRKIVALAAQSTREHPKLSTEIIVSVVWAVYTNVASGEIVGESEAKLAKAIDAETRRLIGYELSKKAV